MKKWNLHLKLMVASLFMFAFFAIMALVFDLARDIMILIISGGILTLLSIDMEFNDQNTQEILKEIRSMKTK